MELIDRLEQRLDALLSDNTSLRQENGRLKEALQRDTQTLQGEVEHLQQELERERAARQAVTARIDGLLQKIEAAATGDAPPHAQP